MRPSSSLKRKVNFKEPKKKFIIFMEGKNTEPDYFNAIKRSFAGSLVDIKLYPAVGVPLTIADAAIRYKIDNLRQKNNLSILKKSDEVWVVFDRDTHPGISEVNEKCKSADIKIGFSDPCFELWLILHFKDFDRPDNHHDVQRELEKCCQKYSAKKGKTMDFISIMEMVPDAEKRAEKQFKRREAEGNPMRPPYTTVYQLTNSIRKNHADFKIS